MKTTSWSSMRSRNDRAMLRNVRRILNEMIGALPFLCGAALVVGYLTVILVLIYHLAHP